MATTTRRRFLLWSAVGLGAAGAGLAGWRTSGYTLDAAVAARLRFFAPWQYLVVQAAAARIVAPETLDVGMFADGYLAALPPTDRRDVRALVGFVEHGAPLLVGRFERFTSLDATTQDAVLRAIEQNAVGKLRGGFNVLKAVACMALYERDEMWAAIDYPGPLVPRGAL
jgi:hypothetical protein